MHHSRNYSYDDGGHQNYSSGYASTQAQYTQQYTRGYHEPHGSAQYFAQVGGNTDVTQPDPYFRSMTPMVSSQPQRYYQNPNGGSSSSPTVYPTHTQFYSQQFQRPQTPGIHASEGGQFIPTPSELYAFSPRQHSVPPQSPPPDPYSSAQYPPPHAYVPSSRSPENRPARISTGRPMTSPGSPIASPSGERFPCERCGKTFSRSHDRKRHHETQHLVSPVIHRCRYCEKEFSRADSLKRHLDNGCDEMPS